MSYQLVLVLHPILLTFYYLFYYDYDLNALENFYFTFIG